MVLSPTAKFAPTRFPLFSITSPDYNSVIGQNFLPKSVKPPVGLRTIEELGCWRSLVVLLMFGCLESDGVLDNDSPCLMKTKTLRN